MTTKFAQSELDSAKQKAGYHRHDDTLPLFLSYAARTEVVHTVLRQVVLSW